MSASVKNFFWSSSYIIFYIKLLFFGMNNDKFSNLSIVPVAIKQSTTELKSIKTHLLILMSIYPILNFTFF